MVVGICLLFTLPLTHQAGKSQETLKSQIFVVILLFAVDMSAMCEMQGSLLCKKLLKWASCYCCVYNGILSCFKDPDSSLPDIQVPLRKCRVSGVTFIMLMS